MPDTIIVSDLDGTLLDATDYSFAAAAPALAEVRARNIPLILCSSKTRAELELYRQRLANGHPFIAENGGGIFIPQNYFSVPVTAEPCEGYHLIRLGLPYADIRRGFVELRTRLGVAVRGFGDMAADEVAELTGLSIDEARLAKLRDFDEVFVFDGAPDTRFLHALETAGLHWTQGRFFHVLGDHDKGRAVTLLQALYRQQYGAVTSIGLGDSLNDLPLLTVVNHPVLVAHPDGSHDARIDLPGLYRTRQPGPAGWNEAVLAQLAGPQPLTRAHAPAQLLDAIFAAALAAVDPYRAVHAAVQLAGDQLRVGNACYDLGRYARIVVVGAGKATARMALALEELLGARIAAGLILVKYGHTEPLRIIEQVEASHPVPDAAGTAGTARVLELVRGADEHTLVLCLLSGGASALLVAPAAGLSLPDKQLVTELLLNAGAPIAELNAVRKHLSAVKGGRLAQAAWPAPVVTLLLSDVIGNRLDVIASGPTAPDTSTFADAWLVLEKYGVTGRVPAHVQGYLQRGMAGQEGETLKPDDPRGARTAHTIVASIDGALAAAAEQAGQLGCTPEIICADLQGEAGVAAQFLAQRARSASAELPAGAAHCLLSGGETTVTVRGAGRGGRNQELALAFALEVEGLAGVTLLSAGTDGTDGPTDAAGAIVDGTTAARARHLGLEPEEYLANNDSYTFFQRFDNLSGEHSHVVTGPTGTNVMDLQIMLCEPNAAGQGGMAQP